MAGGTNVADRRVRGRVGGSYSEIILSILSSTTELRKTNMNNSLINNARVRLLNIDDSFAHKINEKHPMSFIGQDVGLASLSRCLRIYNKLSINA